MIVNIIITTVINRSLVQSDFCRRFFITIHRPSSTQARALPRDSRIVRCTVTGKNKTIGLPHMHTANSVCSIMSAILECLTIPANVCCFVCASTHRIVVYALLNVFTKSLLFQYAWFTQFCVNYFYAARYTPPDVRQVDVM